MEPVYQTTVVATGGRNGKIISKDGVLDVEVRVPKEMGGAGGAFSNPEQLFAAGYAACFDSALNFIAMMDKVKITSSVTATVGVVMPSSTEFNLVVTLDAHIEGVDKDVAQQLLDKAHATCPYSKAIKGNVEVTVNLV